MKTSAWLSCSFFLVPPLTALAWLYGDVPDAKHAWTVHDYNRPKPAKVELGGRRWAIAGSADRACHVYEYPSLKLHGDIRFDQPPWDAECPNGRVWGTLAVLPDGYAYTYLFLTMDRANFPGIPTPNWTYGALYLYGAQEVGE